MDRVSIGRVVGTHGLNGEVKLIPAARDRERFATLQRVYLEGGEGPADGWQVLEAWEHKSTVVLELEGIETIEEAERLVGRELWVDERDAVELEEGEYFVHDLVGMDVVTDRGRTIGKIAEVLDGPGNDIYVVRGPRGEMMVPAVGAIVLKVDLEARRMLIHDLPGLLEPEEPI